MMKMTVKEKLNTSTVSDRFRSRRDGRFMCEHSVAIYECVLDGRLSFFNYQILKPILKITAILVLVSFIFLNLLSLFIVFHKESIEIPSNP